MFFYIVGWRLEEIAALKWRQIDRKNWIVRLETGETINDEARTVYLDDEMVELIGAQWDARKRSKIFALRFGP